MPQKLLQWVGALFLVGLLGASVFLLTIVKDRVRIVVADDAVDSGPDPVALLRDDVATVSRELGDLRGSIGANFERLGTVLEERAETRHADLQALARDVAALRQRLDAERGDLQRSATRLQAIETALAGLAPRPESPVVPPPPSVAEVVPPPADGVPAASTASSAQPVPEPEPAKPKASFLSFSVPTTTFRFDEAQEYVLVPDLSRVGFDAKSTLHDFSGVTSKVSGRFTADLDDPSGAWNGEVACDAGTLLTGVEGRDSNMYEHLDTKNHPQIRFTIAKFVPAENGIDAGKQTARGEVHGTMAIRGVSREIAMPITVEVDASKRLVVKGQVPLKLSDYGVPVPSQLGVINMQDEVVVWVALRARVQTGGRK